MPEDRWSLADRVGDMISVHDRKGVYLFASAAAKELLGYVPQDLVGTSAFDYLHPDETPQIDLALRNTLLGAPAAVVYRLRRQSGEYIWVETTTRVETDDETGEVVELVCSTRRVAHRDSAEDIGAEQGQALRKRVGEVLAEDAVEPVYQPIVDLTTSRAIGFEALTRFPGNAAHTPHSWFADAWRVGLGVPLELLAVRTATSALSRLPEGTGLSINASPPAIAAEGFLPSLRGQADRVAVEVTEHMRVDDFDRVQPKLAALRDAGGQIAIDDFGAGYASFRQVLDVNPDWIKLDTTLSEHIEEDRLSQALVSAVVSFSQRAGVRVIAEGIEDNGQLSTLRDLGIRYGQGYHLGPPAPIEDALETAA